MGEMSRKKKAGIIVLLVVLSLPILAVITVELGLIEGLALDHAPADWAASLDLGVADYYGISLRPRDKEEVCKRFLDRFAGHPKCGYAKYSIAVCIQSKPETANHHIQAAYEEFLDEYRDDPYSKEYVEKAEQALASIALVK